MAKGIYLGVSGKAEKVKKIYVGVDDIAKKVKKAYIGIGGVARPCWVGGETTYYGKIGTFSTDGRCYGSAATVGDYGLFAGGYALTTTYFYNSVDAFDTSMTRISAVNLSSGAMVDHAAIGAGGDALFAGGADSNWGYTDNVCHYDTSLTCESLSVEVNPAGEMGAAMAGTKVLFAGGFNQTTGIGYSNVTACSPDGGVGYVVTEECNTGPTLGANIGEYALFGCYYHPSVSSTINWLYAYNSSLERFTLEDFDFECRKGVGCGNSEFVVFCGGSNYYGTEINVYDGSLTKIGGMPALSTNRQRACSLNIGENILIIGGDSEASENTVDIYDESMTLSTDELSVERSSSTLREIGKLSTTVGEYGFFSIDAQKVYAYTL